MFLPMLQFFNIDRFDFGSDVRKWNKVKKNVESVVLLWEDSCDKKSFTIQCHSHDILYEIPEFITRSKLKSVTR